MASNNLPQPSSAPSTPSSYPSPSRSDLAAVAATVTVVGVLVVFVITWLLVRLRRPSEPTPIPISNRPGSYPYRPSYAPSEASSKFGFIRKPLRLSHRHKDTSWDFADPDPFAHPDTPSRKYRPAPLAPAPAYSPRAQRTSMVKDDAPRTPTTPGTPDFIDPPPPAYCRESASCPVTLPKNG